MENHVYTYEGLIPAAPNKGLPTFALTKEYGKRFMVEVVTNSRCVPSNRKRQSHVWLRVIDDNGAIISAGYFGDRPITSLWEAIRHLYPRYARVLSPDYFEVFTAPRNQRVTPIQISELQYHQMVAFLAEAQEDENRCYQLLDTFRGQNCAGFMLEALDACGVMVPRSQHLNWPSQVITWQESVERWREKRLEEVQSHSVYANDEELDDIRYGLP